MKTNKGSNEFETTKQVNMQKESAREMLENVEFEYNQKENPKLYVNFGGLSEEQILEQMNNEMKIKQQSLYSNVQKNEEEQKSSYSALPQGLEQESRVANNEYNDMQKALEKEEEKMKNMAQQVREAESKLDAEATTALENAKKAILEALKAIQEAKKETDKTKKKYFCKVANIAVSRATELLKIALSYAKNANYEYLGRELEYIPVED